MEGSRSFQMLLVLLLVAVVTTYDCPPHPSQNLSCFSDYNSTITCVWNGTSASAHEDDACTLDTVNPLAPRFKASCNLKSSTSTSPDVKTCSMIFTRTYNFSPSEKYNINLRCASQNRIEKIRFDPFCHIKVNSPGKPSINNTTVSWLPPVSRYNFFRDFKWQLECKKQERSWSEPLVGTYDVQCKDKCEVQLDPENLMAGETYEARSRVKVTKVVEGIWSDWSPSVTWVSSVGKPKSTPGIPAVVLNMAVTGVAFTLLILTVAFLKIEKNIWIYVVKKVRGPPVPNPSKSTPFLNWTSLQVPTEFLAPFLKEVEITPVEVFSPVDTLQPFHHEQKKPNHSLGSSFSNPSYSSLCSPMPSFLAESEGTSTSDPPIGPVRGPEDGENIKLNNPRAPEEELLKLLLSFSSAGNTMEISDYKKVEPLRQGSIDSGTCTCEEVSQESMEADGGGGEEALKEEEGEEVHFLHLFGKDRAVLETGPVPVCSEYERVLMPQADQPELLRPDSNLMTASDQSKSARSPSTFPCPMSLPQHLDFSGRPFNQVLQPPPSQEILECLSLLSAKMAAEPSDGGYKPVRQQ